MHRPCATRSSGESGDVGGGLRDSVVGIASSSQADPNAVAAIEIAGKQSHHEACDGHAEGAGVDGKAHGGTADAEPGDQRRQDGLRGEQVDKRQEGDQRDEAEAPGVGCDRGASLAGLVSLESAIGNSLDMVRGKAGSVPEPSVFENGQLRVGSARRKVRRHIVWSSAIAGGRMSAE